MQNIDVRFGATSNFHNVQGQLAALQKQAEVLSARMNTAAHASSGAMVDARKWQRASHAVNQMSEAYRDAAASARTYVTQADGSRRAVDLFTTSQLRASSQVAEDTRLLQKNRLERSKIVGWNGRLKDSIREVYREQLRLRRMTATSMGTDRYGREITNLAIPNEIPKRLDSINTKLKFARVLARNFSDQMINAGKNIQWTGRQLTVGLTYPMVLAGAAASKAAYDIDKQLVRISKVYDSTLGASASGMEKAAEATEVRARSFELASKMAKEYGLAATEVLGVEAELAATGLTGNRLFEATEETARIATLGELDFQRATDMTVALQNTFKDTIKTSQDLTDTFNFMNTVENETSLSLQDIAEATPRAAAALAQLGVSAEEMTIMLVAMREAGVEAKQGANALKSLSTRILNPTPQAEALFAGELGKYGSIEEITDATGGNLMDFLKEFSKVTKDMDKTQFQKGVAKLAGTYQFSRVNALMTNLVTAQNDLGDETNQTARAFNALGNSAKENAQAAKDELEEMAESASGQFQRAWQTLKVTAGRIGEGFLPIVTQVINGFNAILVEGDKLWDKLPGWGKKITKWTAIAVGMAGPVIMMSGIIANLLGWGMKLLSIGPKFAVLNRAQAAAAIHAKQAKQAYLDEAAAVEILKAEMLGLAEAQGYATGVGQVALQTGRSQRTIGRSAAEVLPPGHSAKFNKHGNMMIFNERNKITSARKLGLGNWVKEQELINRETMGSRKNIEGAADATERGAKSAGRMRKNFTASKVAAGLMGAAIISDFIPGVKEMNGGLMEASMAMMGIVMMKDLVGGFGVADRSRKASAATRKHAAEAAKSANTMRNAMKANVALAAAQLTPWKKATTLIKGAGGGVKNIFKMLQGLWAKAGKFLKFGGLFGAIFGGIQLFRYLGRAERASNEAAENQSKITKGTDEWVEHLDGAAGKYKELNRLTKEQNEELSRSEQFAKEIKEDEGAQRRIEEFKRIRETGDGTGNDSLFDMRAMELWIDMIKRHDMTVDDARVAMTTFLTEAGYEADVVRVKVEQMYREIGKGVDFEEQAFLIKKQFDEIADVALGSNEFDARVKDMGAQIEDTLSRAPDALARGRFMDKVIDEQVRAASSAFMGVRQELEETLEASPITQDAIEILGFRNLNSQEMTKVLDTMFREVSRNGLPAMEDLLGDTVISGRMGNLLDMNFEDNAEGAMALHAVLREVEASVSDYGSEYTAMLQTEEALVKMLAKHAGLSEEITTMAELEKAMREDNFAITSRQMRDQYNEMLKTLHIGENLTDEQKLTYLNIIRTNNGLKKTNNLADGFNREVTEVEQKTRQIANNVNGTNAAWKRLSNAKAFEDFDFTGANKQAWQNVVSGVADQAEERFSAQQDAEMSALEARFERQNDSMDRTFDSQVSKMEARHERVSDSMEARHSAAASAMSTAHEKASSALDAAHDREMAALDRRAEYWSNYYDNAIDKANKYYDKRIEGVEKTIKAEEKANEIRERIFEAEERRLQRFADMRNRNIDFNTAISTGQLDEAAKLLNDAEATTASNQMDDERKKADIELEERKESLQRQIELLEKQRDRRIEALENAREAKERAIAIARERAQKENELEKQALEKRQAMQQAALEKKQEAERKQLAASQEAQKDNLEREQEAHRKNLEAQQNNQKNSLSQEHKIRREYYQMALDELKAFIPRNAKQLQQHINDINKRYDKYGDNLIGEASKWAGIIKNKHTREMQRAAIELKTHVNWQRAGKDSAIGMLKGMAEALGFPGPKAFAKWIGINLPKASGPGKNNGKDGGGVPGVNNSSNIKDTGSGPLQFHTGGEIGKDRGGRTGYTGSLSSKETLINAEKGEYMMSRKAVNKYGTDFMSNVNDGKLADPKKHGTGGPGLMGFSGAMMPFMAKSMWNMLSNMVGAKAYKKMAAEQAVMGSGSYTAAGAGQYGGTHFNSDQLSNAAVIASVGRSLGVGQRGILVALMTAMQESTLRNLNYGDRDSQGLFQQRPSQGWGSISQITNPRLAAKAFFGRASHTSNPGLLDIAGWEDMPLTVAAQTVQRSAYPSAYAKWEDEARAIIKGMQASPGTGGTMGGKGGRGGWARPSKPGKGWSNTHDYRNSIGSPLYAYNDGRVVRSEAITSGGSSGNGIYTAPNGRPYRSYGELIAVRGNDGNVVNYAHLSPGKRFVRAGQRVKGGALIGLSGNTGNSTGPHTHFDVNGSYNAKGFFASKGIGLRKGGELRWDNTMANLHNGETVLTKPLTQKFKQAVENGGNVAGGGANEYTVTIDLRYSSINKDVDIKSAVKEAINEMNAKVGRKRVVKG